MGLRERWRMLLKRLLRRHGDVKSFEHEIHALGGMVGSRDAGITTVPTARVVGSVSRWRNLRSDFFYRHGQAMTERFVRIGSAMRQGKAFPPLELYKMKVPRPGGKGDREVSEYYVVDGHHRVAMARKLGQDFLDARVVEYQVVPAADDAAPSDLAPTTPEGQAAEPRSDATAPAESSRRDESTPIGPA